MSFAEKAREAIEEIIKNWTKKYMYNITLLDTTEPEFVFMVEFSLPTAEKPIPIGTVQVYFYASPTNPIQLKFKFEKDSLVHTPDQTLRSTQMENWIESLLHKKLLIRQNVFYLGTEYEVTRVKDARQDKILEVKQIPVLEQYVYINPDLLSDQKRAVELESRVLTKDYYLVVRQAFRAIDTDGLGVVTNEQLIEILNNLNLKLDDKEINQITTKVDKDNQGLVTFEEYRQIADQVTKMMIAKDEAVNRLKNNDQQYQIVSIMMLVSDNIHDIKRRLTEKFKKVDQDELGYLRLPDIKAILEEVNLEISKEDEAKVSSKAKQTKQPPKGVNQNKSQNKKEKRQRQHETAVPLLTLMELQQFVKKLSQRYPFAQVKYQGIVKELLEFKLANLRKGLLDSNQTILQIYIRDLLAQKDQDQLGKVHVSELVEALQQSEKIKLTKGQLYVVKSIVEKDNKDMISYVPSAKVLAEVLKRMYLTHEKMRQDPVQYLDRVEEIVQNKPQSAVSTKIRPRKESESSQKKQSRGSERNKSGSAKRQDSKASNRSKGKA